MKPANVAVAVSWGLPRTGLPSRTDFARWASRALTGRRDVAELSIRVVDTDEGREINRQYRHKDYATNVLSFPAELPAEVGVPLIGDLVICAPVVAAEAQAQGKSAKEHWAHLTIHGVLHLVGYDHETPGDARLMEGIEREVLDSLGIPDPYVAR